MYFYILCICMFVNACTVCVFVAKECPKEDWLPAIWLFYQSKEFSYLLTHYVLQDCMRASNDLSQP